MTIETVIAWLAENPEWHGPLRASWTFLVAHVISYIWMSLFVIYMNRGEPRDKWLWERNAVRHVCAWPLYLATWPLRALWRWHKNRRWVAANDVMFRDLARRERNSSEIPNSSPVPYGSKPDESKRPVTEERLRHVLSDYVRPCDLEPMIARLAALEAWQRLAAPDFTATPPASEPEVRVFSDDCFGPPIYALFSPQGKFWRSTHATWGDCVISGLEEFAERATGGRTQCRELHGPEKDSIVAEWRKWRAGQ